METRFTSDRSRLAFDWTCKAFVDYAARNKQKVYFWTFTFVKKMPDSYYCYRWAGFIRDVGRLYSDGIPLLGVKVTEPHRRAAPGSRWRGLHFHCLVNHRVPVGEVRRIGARYGIGRVQVKRVWNMSGSVNYLAKYMRKGFKEKKLAPGIRRWSTIGGFDGVTVASVQITSPLTTACREMKAALGRNLTFPEQAAIWRSDNISDPTHRAFCVWYAKQPENAKNPLAALSFPWWELEREIGLPDNPLDGLCPF